MPPVDNTGRLGGTRDLSTRDLGTRDLDIGSPVGGGRGLATRPAPGPGMKAGGLAGAPVLPIGETTDYEVKQGDTIWTVAKHFHVTRAALAAANNIPVDSQLKLKQKLKIPAATPGAAPAGGVTPPAGGPTTRAATKPAAGMPAAKFPTYTVKKGDDLSKVSEAAYGDRKYWKKIYTANKAAIGENPNVLKEGLVLKMP
jgi:LysM repeat protein